MPTEMPTNIIDPTWTFPKFAREQRKRLLFRAAIAAHAASLPRRLGAGPRASSLDKRRSRRVAHAALKNFNTWGGAVTWESLDDYREGFGGLLRPGQVAIARTEGAIVQWRDYVVVEKARLTQIREDGERAARALGLPTEANQIHHNIHREIEHLEFAIRDDTKGSDYDD